MRQESRATLRHRRFLTLTQYFHDLAVATTIEEVALSIQWKTAFLLTERARRYLAIQDRFIYIPLGTIRGGTCLKLSHQPGQNVEEGKMYYTAQNGAIRIVCDVEAFVVPGEPAVLIQFDGRVLITQVCVRGNTANFKHWYPTELRVVPGYCTIIPNRREQSQWRQEMLQRNAPEEEMQAYR